MRKILSFHASKNHFPFKLTENYNRSSKVSKTINQYCNVTKNNNVEYCKL